MRKLAAIALFLFCLAVTASAAAPDAFLFAYVDKKDITIGDRVKLTLELGYSKGVKLEQFVPEDNLKSFEVKSFKISKPRRKYLYFGKYVKKYEYIVSTFTTGVYEIKPFTIKFTPKNGAPAECQTSPLKINVASMLDKESAADIRDIKPPVNFRGAWLFYLVVILIPLIILAGFIAWRNYLKKEEFFGSLPENIDPYEYASGELEKLKNSDYMKNGMAKEFYIRMTYIVRVYLSKICGINITDMTTNESIRALREKVEDRKFLMTLREFFELADLVKFAKYLPSEKDAAGSLSKAVEIIDALKPSNPATSAAEAGK